MPLLGKIARPTLLGHSSMAFPSVHALIDGTSFLLPAQVASFSLSQLLFRDDGPILRPCQCTLLTLAVFIHYTGVRRRSRTETMAGKTGPDSHDSRH